MKKLYPCLLLFLISCQSVKIQKINQTSWLPYLVLENNEVLGSHQFTGNSITFTDADSLIIQTLGTDFKKSYAYETYSDSITYFVEDRKVGLKIFNLSEDELVFQVGRNTILCKQFPVMQKQDQSERIQNLLSGNAWILNESTIIEFEDTLDFRLVKPHLHNQLLSAVMHYQQDDYYPNHVELLYGVSYQNNSNVLVINDLYGSGLKMTSFIETVNDSLIIANRINNHGVLEKDTLRLLPTISNPDKLIGKWRLSEFEEVEMDLVNIWGSYVNQFSLTDSLMTSAEIELVFEADGNYSMQANGIEVLSGSWQETKSGQLIRLINEYKDEYDTIRSTTFLTPVTIDENEMRIFKPEDLQQKDGSYQRKYFMANYSKLK